MFGYGFMFMNYMKVDVYCMWKRVLYFVFVCLGDFELFSIIIGNRINIFRKNIYCFKLVN